jgi:hypothetical protein
MIALLFGNWMTRRLIELPLVKWWNDPRLP